MARSGNRAWKRGRGKLGALEPLIGTWVAEADSPMGRLRCTRRFTRILDGKYVALDAEWALPKGSYLEHAIYGAGDDGAIVFWSFTSDGKRSEGRMVEAPDVHAAAIAFEAQMPAGLARMVYWPGAGGAIEWAVESRTKQGWNRFTHHVYAAVGD